MANKTWFTVGTSIVFLQLKAKLEAKLYKELSEAQDKNIKLETKAEDLDRKCRMQQDQIFELKEQITHLQAEQKLKGSHFEGKRWNLSQAEQKFKE